MLYFRFGSISEPPNPLQQVACVMASSRAVRPSLAAILLPSSRPTSSSTAAVALLLPRKTQQIGNQVSRFSTSPTLLKRHTYAGARKTRDNNKHRGESTIRRTGPRWRLSVSDEPLPRPVAPKDLPQVETDPNHGLWDFFYDKTTTVNPPTQDSQHGRPWSVEELRHKSWDDLHKLWWVCVKERNRIATSSYEREKLSLGFGAAEAQKRDAMVSLLPCLLVAEARMKSFFPSYGNHNAYILSTRCE